MAHRETMHRSLAASAPAVCLLAAVLALSGCGAFSGQGGANPVPTGDRNAEGEDISVRIENNAWDAIHVYVVAGSRWNSLGVVSSQGRSDYTVPSSSLGGRGEIRLVADPIGSTEGYFSDPILVEPGDRVEWTLQNNLSLSSVMVR